MEENIFINLNKIINGQNGKIIASEISNLDFYRRKPLFLTTSSLLASTAIFGINNTKKDEKSFAVMELPIEEAILTAAPSVPPPIKRDYPVKLVVKLDADLAQLQLTKERKYRAWAFNRTIPGPFIRVK